MEQYLIDDYDVYEDKEYLQSETDIENYFSDGDSKEFFDCGQGYYEDEYSLICKIGDRFFQVTIYAEIGSAKQDRGDRLYWVEDVVNVSYKEIDKPLPKEKNIHEIKIKLTTDQYRELRIFMIENNMLGSVLKHTFPIADDRYSYETSNPLM